MLLSRLELVEPEVRFLLKPDIPSIRTGVRLRSGDVIMLYGVHPEPPSPTEAATSLPRDAELVMAGREIAQSDRPTLVAGDLNDVAWSHTSRLFRRIARMLDPRVGRGMYHTFHARYWLLRSPTRPRLRQQHLPAAPAAAPPCVRLRSFSDLHRARSCARGQRGAGGARARRRGPRRSARQAAARGSDRGRSAGEALRSTGFTVVRKLRGLT